MAQPANLETHAFNRRTRRPWPQFCRHNRPAAATDRTPYLSSGSLFRQREGGHRGGRDIVGREELQHPSDVGRGWGRWCLVSKAAARRLPAGAEVIDGVVHHLRLHQWCPGTATGLIEHSVYFPPRPCSGHAGHVMHHRRITKPTGKRPADHRPEGPRNARTVDHRRSRCWPVRGRLRHE